MLTASLANRLCWKGTLNFSKKSPKSRNNNDDVFFFFFFFFVYVFIDVFCNKSPSKPAQVCQSQKERVKDSFSFVNSSSLLFIECCVTVKTL